jgi:amidase
VDTNPDLAWMPALEQARLIRSKELSPTELCELYLRRIECHDGRLNSYLTVAAEQALAGARQAEQAVMAGDPLGPFHGVPMSVKDLADTAGIRTTMGTAAWKDRVPDDDDEVVRRLRVAGFVLLGKTNTPEFGSAVFTEPIAYGPCLNPWDTTRTPGGSSGGAAAALAAGLCAISHGTDGGGSTRIPSAWCGLVGFKPSRGRISASPHPQNLFTTNGALARTVADAAAMLDAMAGYATGDAFWAPPPTRPFLDEVREAPGRLRIAVAPGRPDIVVDPDYQQAVRDTASLLADLGHDVMEALPPFTEVTVDNPVVAAAAATFAATSDGLPPFETLDPINQGFIRLGRTVSAKEVILAQLSTAATIRTLVAFFDSYDVLVTPTTAVPAPPIGRFRHPTHPWETFLEVLPFTPFTADWNMTGQPAVSLPLYVDRSGLPIGIQLVGRPAAEATLVRIASQLEQAAPWADRRPAGWDLS